MQHRVFVNWSFYVVCVFLLTIFLWHLNIIQQVLTHDSTSLTTIILGVYVFAEITAGVQAWQISKELNSVWFVHSLDKSITPVEIFNVSSFDRHSIIGKHITDLFKANDFKSPRVDQSILLDVMADKLDGRISTVEFVSSKIVWLGILATIVGVILAFWPLLNVANFDIANIKDKLNGFFSGIAVAFVPTAVSFVCKILLSVSSRILEDGAKKIVQLSALISETRIIPFLSNVNATQ